MRRENSALARLLSAGQHGVVVGLRRGRGGESLEIDGTGELLQVKAALRLLEAEPRQPGLLRQLASLGQLIYFFLISRD